MTDPGLSRRLRQQAHRSGLAVGLTMALAIAVCIGGFTWLYVQLDPWARDFAGAEVAPPTRTPRDTASDDQEQEEQPDESEGGGEDAQSDDPEPTNTPEPDEDEDESDIQPVDEDDGEFDPDYQVIALEQVNIRSGPGRNFDIVVSVNPGTPLQSTGGREPAPDPADAGLSWLEFETEDGQRGWIREIDVGET
jgi:hypothetical protein